MAIENAPFNWDYRYLSEHRYHRWEQPNFDEVVTVKKDMGKKLIEVKPTKKRKRYKTPLVATEKDKFKYRFKIPDQIKLQDSTGFIKKSRYGLFPIKENFYV